MLWWILACDLRACLMPADIEVPPKTERLFIVLRNEATRLSRFRPVCSRVAGKTSCDLLSNTTTLKYSPSGAVCSSISTVSTTPLNFAPCMEPDTSQIREIIVSWACCGISFAVTETTPQHEFVDGPTWGL